MFRKVFILIFLSVNIYAQKEYNNWYLGNKAGITFNSGSPIALIGSQIYAWEGCASISDVSGNLLFYTNGREIYNRNHDTMGSGLSGGWSSTQATIIIPLPGNNSLYYIFCAPEIGIYQEYNLTYSIVDMSLNDGLGGVTIDKNILLAGDMGEKLTYVRHYNESDYWIIAHGKDNNRFYVWHLSSSGIAEEITSNTGSVHRSNNNASPLGYMKVSHNNKKMALAVNDIGGTAPTAKIGFIEIFDFDNQTGIISNPKHIPDILRPYGLEFSPDNSKLFTGSGDGAVEKMYQYNLTDELGNELSEVEIKSSEQILNISGAVGAFQLGPDGKIYVARFGETYLGIINDPNGSGLNSYTSDGVSLGNGISLSGLPNYTIEYTTPPEEVNCGKLFIANSFSPNNDGINDLFCIKNIDQGQMTVYDIWGTKVFESNDNINKCWDGTNVNHLLNSGNYIYIFNHETCGTIKGNIFITQ